MSSDAHPARWRKSSYSNGDGGECIEFDDANPGRVRDSKDPHGPVLAFSPVALNAFVQAVAAGEFDGV
ncbi:DUF397 domain-containing protein [Kitasatospora indigofera]|uniref:DUF397 domain-containing protein n=1 Tax=Kitasatospora indigofera TaxID=67307 RepID=UPI0036A80733